MKKIKALSTTLAIALTTCLLGGCGASEKLSKAIDSNANLKSYAFKMNYKISDLGNGKENGQNVSLGNIDMKIDGRVVQEKDKKAKAEMNTKYNIMGQDINMNIISSVDIQKNKYEIFMNIPEQMKSEIAKINKDVQYLYIGNDSMEKMQKEMKANGADMPKNDVKEMTDSMTNLQDGMNTFVKEYISKNGKDIITDQGQKEVDVRGTKEKVQSYQVKVDDAGFKKFLKSFLEDKNRKAQLEKILEKILPKDEKGKVDYKKALENIDKMPKIIGDKGATLELGVKDNHVVSEKADMNLVLEGNNINYKVDMVLFDLDKEMDIKVPKKDNKVIDFFEYISKMISAEMNMNAN